MNGPQNNEGSTADGLDADAWQERLDRLSALLEPIANHANTQATWRCPYKNRHNRCTAEFGCRNQRLAADDDLGVAEKIRQHRFLCSGDDKLDYRSAWEVESGEMTSQETLATLIHRQQRPHISKGIRLKAADEHNSGTASCGTERMSLVAGSNLFDYADRASIQVASSCARTGICHECVVQVEAGLPSLSPRTEAEKFLQDPFRLACQAEITDLSAQVTFQPLRRPLRILTDSSRANRTVEPDSLANTISGADRDRYRGRDLGLAIDLGTTTVVMKVIELESEATIVTASFANPQGFAGSDIMNRISYAAGNFTDELQHSIVNAINTEIRTVARSCGFRRTSVVKVFVAGNPTMRDILFGLDVQGLGQRPYRSIIEEDFHAGRRTTTEIEAPARQLGLHLNPQARVVGLPLIGSHVGADTAACLLTIGMADLDRPVMLVDVGTNTEVVGGYRDRLIAASCPAGPAFEGGLITYGMPAYEGAIESLTWKEGTFSFDTIGDTPPEGICGSGLIDLVAELRRHGLITPKGVFTTDRRLKQIDVVPGSITFSRADASALAQAKAANYCGQLIAMRHFGIEPSKLDRLYLAGGFANYVNAQNAIEIGMLAPVSVDKIEKLGNAAVEGARLALVSEASRERINLLAKHIEHVELELEPDFFELFVDGCRFEPMQLSSTAG